MELLVILTLLFPSGILGHVNDTMRLELGSLGTVFSPYSKYNGDKSSETYPISEIETMLEIVSKRFQKVTTYGMGTKSPTSHWNDTNDAEGLTAYAAARLNQKLGTLAISLEAGVWQKDPETTRQELENALDVAIESNKIFNGTVSGIIIGSQYSAHQLDGLYHSLTAFGHRIKSLSLELGIRSTTCSSMDINNTAIRPYLQPITYILSNLDFVICQTRPVGDGGNISEAIEVIGNNLLRWRENFRKFNPNIKIFGETGWPSQYSSQEGVPGSVENMKLFWLEMGMWSKRNDFRVDLFSAFDDPSKSFHAEAHYGWWTRIRNDTNGEEAFAEKIFYKKPEPGLLGKSFGLEIGLGLVGAFLVLTLLGSGLLYRRLRIVKSQLLTKSDIKEFKHGKHDTNFDGLTEDALRLPYDRSYEISKTKFIIDKTQLLGSGAFGMVYKGKLEENLNDVVAFKMTQSDCSSSTLKSLLSELKVMIHVGKHLNVVTLLGAYTGEIRQGRVVIATELCELGSLEKHLRMYTNLNLTLSPLMIDATHYTNDPTSRLSRSSKLGVQFQDLVKWSYQISCGMLHIASKNVIHSDLATRNVLLTKNGTAKITDFGLSRHLYEYTNYVKSNQEPLPWRWMALESLQHLTFSTKSDVWAYGITIWEIFSLGDTPYPGLGWTADFTRELRRGLRMNRPEYATPEIYSKMCECWNDEPSERPGFAVLKDFFETMLFSNIHSGEIPEHLEV